MSATIQEIIVAIICVLVIGIGWRWGVTAIHGGTVERSSNPIAFWFVMGLAGVMLIAMVALAIVGK